MDGVASAGRGKVCICLGAAGFTSGSLTVATVIDRTTDRNDNRTPESKGVGTMVTVALHRSRMTAWSSTQPRVWMSLICLLPLLASAGEPPPGESMPRLIPSSAFGSLLHPNCSHCAIEDHRRATELRADDRVVCWIQVEADGYTNDGAVPIRFFLNKYRVLSDGWGVFVYDPDAGYARGFAPAGDEFRFHGWRNGVTVMQGKDGTLYSGLTGIAFEGPKKGSRLKPEATLVTVSGANAIRRRWHT
jgi:hypothetical protein